MGKRLDVQNGTVCRLPGERLGFFGWPTVARLEDGLLMVASSGLRSQHICPWGKTVLNISHDDGRTWSKPGVIQDSMIDDRDAGLVNLGGSEVLVSWFRSDTRQYADIAWAPFPEWAREWEEASAFATWTDETVAQLAGSWVMRSHDAGQTWGDPIRVPVSAPHGPIRLRSGELLYLGKPYGTWTDMNNAGITAARSADTGYTWQLLGQVPVHPSTDSANYHEPHLVELPSGRLLGMIRIEDHAGKDLKAAGIPSFSLMQTESDDGGRTWTVPRSLGFHGSPPHLLRHSSGMLILSYGYRQAPYGQRVALSHDDGATWDADWILRDDGPNGSGDLWRWWEYDLGYPSTVELADGSLLTAYYQKAAEGEKCSLLWSRWQLP